jgi:hypothetical protein
MNNKALQEEMNRESVDSRPSFQSVELEGNEGNEQMSEKSLPLPNTPHITTDYFAMTNNRDANTIKEGNDPSELTPLRGSRSFDKTSGSLSRYLDEAQRENRRKVCCCFSSRKRCCWSIWCCLLLFVIILGMHFFVLILPSHRGILRVSTNPGS